MEAKLMLRADKNLIDEEKEYAQRKYSPLVEELSGIISLDQDFDFKEDYSNYLIEKYR